MLDAAPTDEQSDENYDIDMYRPSYLRFRIHKVQSLSLLPFVYSQLDAPR